MSSKSLRSVLAVAFSVGLALGVFGTLDLAWDSAPAKTTGVQREGVVAAVGSDLAWDIAPVKTAGA